MALNKTGDTKDAELDHPCCQMHNLAGDLKMRLLLSLLFSTAVFGAQVSTDPAVYAVSYIEVTPAGRGAAVAAFKQYRDISRTDMGYTLYELFEQIERPGHFAIVETWANQNAFDGHTKDVHLKEFVAKLQQVRVSGYDQRPYKTLAVGRSPAASNGRAVYVVTHVDVAGPQADAPGLLRRLAEASRKEDGNLRFDVVQHTMRANHFTIVEGWQSEKAREAHAAAPHTKQYRDELQPMTGSPLDERVYKAVE
jgi:quinol monooxygenase YgiN